MLAELRERDPPPPSCVSPAALMLLLSGNRDNGIQMLQGAEEKSKDGCKGAVEQHGVTAEWRGGSDRGGEESACSVLQHSLEGGP